MATALDKTIHFLGNSRIPQAVDVLLAALDLPDKRYQLETAQALLKHSSARGRVALIRRLPELTAETVTWIHDNAEQFFPSLNHCLRHANTKTRECVLEFICTHQLLGHLPSLIASLTEHTDRPARARLEAAQLLSLHLYDRLRVDESPSAATDGNTARVRSWTQQTFEALATACGKIKDQPDPRFVVETILALGSIDHPVVERLFSLPETRQLATECLMTSRHPGVLRCLFDFLNTAYPQSAALNALNHRDDLALICHLLRWFRDKPPRAAQNNLKLIGSLPWIEQGTEILEQIPSGLLQILPQFVARTRVPQEQQDRLLTWLVQHGRAPTRIAADGILDRMDSEMAESIVIAALDHVDPAIQAWATSRLRGLKSQQALHCLLKQLDSPFHAVRQAACHAMRDFNLETMLRLFDSLDPKTCHRAGHLLLKTQSDCLVELQAELTHDNTRRRLRGVRGTQALGLVDHMLPHLIPLANDPSPEIVQTVWHLLNYDRSPELMRIRKRLERVQNSRSPDATAQHARPFTRRDNAHPLVVSSSHSTTRHAARSHLQ